MKYSLDMRVLLYSNESLTSHVKENLKQNVAYFCNEKAFLRGLNEYTIHHLQKCFKKISKYPPKITERKKYEVLPEG